MPARKIAESVILLDDIGVHSIVTPTLVDEHELPKRDRREAGALLAAEWGPAWRKRAYAGDHPPQFRSLAHNRAGHVLAHASAFAIPTDPSRALYGIGDLVVKARYRGRGLARAICTELVAECWRRGAQTVLVDTVDARAVFEQLGFAQVTGFTYWYATENACVRRRHWLSAASAAEHRTELLENGDF